MDRSLTSLHSLNVFLILSINSIRKYTIPCIYTQKKEAFASFFSWVNTICYLVVTVCLTPENLTSTRRSGARHSISFLRFLIPSHSEPVTGLVLP